MNFLSSYSFLVLRFFGWLFLELPSKYWKFPELSPSLLDFYCSYKKWPQTQWLKTAKMYSLTVQKFETGLPGLKSAGHQVVLLSEGCHKEPFSYIFQLVLPPFPHLQKSLISLPKLFSWSGCLRPQPRKVLHFEASYFYLRPAWIIRENFPISKAIN